jgi:MFS family permease
MRYNTIINTSAMVGLTVGSFIAGYSIIHGRVKAIIVWQVVALIGCGLTLVRTLPTICLGRFMIGLCAGCMNVAAAKCIDETVPSQLQSAFGATTNLVTMFACMLAMILGFILPTSDS